MDIFILDSSVVILFPLDIMGGILGTQITPGDWNFWTTFFFNLKNSGQDLSNEGSNFILSSLEIGH